MSLIYNIFLGFTYVLIHKKKKKINEFNEKKKNFNYDLI